MSPRLPRRCRRRALRWPAQVGLPRLEVAAAALVGAEGVRVLLVLVVDLQLPFRATGARLGLRVLLSVSPAQLDVVALAGFADCQQAMAPELAAPEVLPGWREWLAAQDAVVDFGREVGEEGHLEGGARKDAGF